MTRRVFERPFSGDIAPPRAPTPRPCPGAHARATARPPRAMRPRPNSSPSRPPRSPSHHPTMRATVSPRPRPGIRDRRAAATRTAAAAHPFPHPRSRTLATSLPPTPAPNVHRSSAMLAPLTHLPALPSLPARYPAGLERYESMPDFRLYNTMTRGAEPFAPQDGRTVRMYTCGPTVYNPAHLGNFRTFLFEDLLRRTLRLRGWGVRQVMNQTDVDDKIITRASQTGLTISEVTEPVTATFQKDREFLRIEPAEVYPKATEHINEMIALVQRLMDKQLAYQAEDGSVYFAIARFPGYGKLSRLDTRDIRPGARVAADDYNKEDVRDFALWKAAKPEDERTGA